METTPKGMSSNLFPILSERNVCYQLLNLSFGTINAETLLFFLPQQMTSQKKSLLLFSKLFAWVAYHEDTMANKH